MVIALLTTNIVLLFIIAAMVIFYFRKPKSKIDKEAEKEREEQRKAIKNIMNYNIDIARRANRLNE